MACEEHGELSNEDVFDDCCIICQGDTIEKLTKLVKSAFGEGMSLGDGDCDPTRVDDYTNHSWLHSDTKEQLERIDG